MKDVKSFRIKSSREGLLTHFEKSVILEIVRKKESGLSNKILCQEYGMSSSALRGWMNLHGSATYKSGMRIMHSPQQIRPIVRAILEGRLTPKEAALKCKVSLDSIKKWVKNFQQEEADLSVLKQDVMPTPAPPPADTGLLQELEAAKLKIKALETMIEVAEEQFKIPIRKKFGAKQ
jgi:transposase